MNVPTEQGQLVLHYVNSLICKSLFVVIIKQIVPEIKKPVTITFESNVRIEQNKK